MKYCVLECNSLSELEDKVNSFIADGWQPQGGISVREDLIYTTTTYYYQAMIKN